MSIRPLLIGLESFVLQMLGQKLERISVIKICLRWRLFRIRVLNQIFQFCKEIVYARPENRSRMPYRVSSFIS
jgi:hypothetical protein